MMDREGLDFHHYSCRKGEKNLPLSNLCYISIIMLSNVIPKVGDNVVNVNVCLIIECWHVAL